MNENLINNSNITCSKCGTSNMLNTKFCIKCGNQLQNETVIASNPFNQQINMENAQPSMNPFNPQVNMENAQPSVNPFNPRVNMENVQPSVNPFNPQVNMENVQPNIGSQVNINDKQFNSTNSVQTTYNSNVKAEVENMNYFKYMLNAILKPFDSFKKEESNLSSFKNTGILVTIIVIIITILNLISTMISSVRVTSIWSDEVNWVWENLKNVEYFKIICKNLLSNAGILFATSGVYYLASLVLKKEIKFVKLLSATTTAFVPMALAITILSPIFSLINTYIGLIITIVGIVYFLVILLELLNDQIIIENKNTRIYFHLVCLSILLIVGGFISYKFMLGSITSELGLFG